MIVSVSEKEIVHFKVSMTAHVSVRKVVNFKVSMIVCASVRKTVLTCPRLLVFQKEDSVLRCP